MTSVIQMSKIPIFIFCEPAGLQDSILQQNSQPILNAEKFSLQLHNAYCLKGQKVTPRGKESLMLILTFVPMIDPCKMG